MPETADDLVKKAMKNRDAHTAQPSFCIRSTPFGPVVLLWSIFDDRPRISRILLSTPAASAGHQVSVLCPESGVRSCSEINIVAADIERFLHGEDIRFSLEVVRMEICSEFQQRVLRAEYEIPRGSISSYQGIARHLGSPNGARAVGNALATNPFPLIIPCHRAIRSDRLVGGYQGGPQMKRTLLEMEGIRFGPTGRVTTKNFFY